MASSNNTEIWTRETLEHSIKESIYGYLERDHPNLQIDHKAGRLIDDLCAMLTENLIGPEDDEDELLDFSGELEKDHFSNA